MGVVVVVFGGEGEAGEGADDRRMWVKKTLETGAAVILS